MMWMYTCNMKRKTVQWKVTGYINRCNPGRSDKKSVEAGWKPTQKIDILKLVETDKIFSRGIMRE